MKTEYHLSKEQEEEFKKDFENWIAYGESAMEMAEEGNFRSLSMEEFNKLKAEIEGEWLRLFP